MLDRDWKDSYHTKETLLEPFEFRKMQIMDSDHIPRSSGRHHGDHRLYMESKIMLAEILSLAYSRLEGDARVISRCT